MKRLHGYLAALVALFSTAAALGEPAISSCTIDTYLTGKSSPIKGLGTEFVNDGLQFQVDPRLVVAIAGNESGFGKNACAQFNAWGFLWGGTCAQSAFISWNSGIHSVTRSLSKTYLNKGLTTIPLISTTYCKSGCGSWIPLVTQFYTELGGNTANLGFSSIDTSNCASSPNPECAPATCSTFVSCSGNGVNNASCGDPVCASTAGGGGVCLEGSTACAGLTSCTTSADCPGGGLCAVNTCCGGNVCVPRDAFCQ